MRYGICIAAAAAALMAVPAIAGPLTTEFSSQVVIDGPGVDVRIGDRDRDHWRHREGWREREVRGGCKTVTVKERGPGGTMITKTKSNC